MSDNTMVSVENLTVRFRIRNKRKTDYIQPVDKITLKINRGEVLALVGESGSGKTSIGRALVRTIEPASGKIVVDGQDVTHIRGKKLRQYYHTTQMVFQDPFGSLNPVQTVEQHLKYPVHLHAHVSGDKLYQYIEELLERVGLTPVKTIRAKYPHELSGGQRQRLAIARALAVQPRVIIADEPISMLDVSIRAGVLSLMNNLRNELGLSYLYITHDLASARYFGDRIMVIYGGMMMEMAESAGLIRSPRNPYTELLLAAAPGSPIGKEIVEDSEKPPDLTIRRRGCPFAPRCHLAVNRCFEEKPPARELESHHLVACHQC